ncbi:porin family protein [Sabulibacter ruber]|uniref:porin family protein n=1 Tax=Sabulibacter ruber TaxID=2811901 RepID=UPI001A96CBD0|nr:porin family protein [Sabulibacter ruber]
MKNFICAVALSLGAASFCSAQSTPGSTQVGILVGPNRTHLNRSKDYFDWADFKSDFRGAAGLSVKHQFASLFLKADLLYENKGDRIDYTTTDANGYPSGEHSLRFNYHYLSLPVLLGIHIKQTGFFVNAGPSVSWLLKQTNKTNEKSDIPFADEDTTSDWKRLDVGVAGGIGYSRPIASALNLSAEVRHTLGLLNISKSSNSVRTSSTNLLLGLHYTLAGK